MKIWLIKEGEPLPCDESPRLMRTGLLAEYLSNKGNEVIWWTSTFEHGKKKQRFDEDKNIVCFENCELRLLHTKTVYKKNTSFQRIIYHKQLAKRFFQEAKKEKKPDLIFCSYPTIDFAVAAIKYGKKYQVPVVLDVRDLWPDIFERVIPRKLQFLKKLVLFPFNRKAKYALSNATCITAINDSHLKWALNKAGREMNDYDTSAYLGYKKTILAEEEIVNQEEFWKKQGITSDTWNICYFGTMSKMTLDMETVISAFDILSKDNDNLRLILCGDGDSIDYFKSLSTNKNIIFPGWVNKNQINYLMSISKLGLYNFHNLPDFINSFTNKIIEYLSGGLPVITSLKGFSKDYLLNNKIGLYYEEKNVESFVNSAKTLIDNEGLRKEMSQKAIDCYYKELTSDKTNEKIYNMFIKLLNKGE